MAIPNLEPIHPVDVQIFHRIGDNFDLLVAPDKMSGLSVDDEYL